MSNIRRGTTFKTIQRSTTTNFKIEKLNIKIIKLII
jgi:hypothetical protein